MILLIHSLLVIISVVCLTAANIHIIPETAKIFIENYLLKEQLPWQWKNSCRDNVRIAVVIIKEQLLWNYLNRLLRYYLNLTCQMFSTGYRRILKRLWMSIRKLRTEIQSFRISVRSFRTKRNKSSALCYYIYQYNTLYSDKVQ